MELWNFWKVHSACEDRCVCAVCHCYICILSSINCHFMLWIIMNLLNLFGRMHLIPYQTWKVRSLGIQCASQIAWNTRCWPGGILSWLADDKLVLKRLQSGGLVVAAARFRWEEKTSCTRCHVNTLKGKKTISNLFLTLSLSLSLRIMSSRLPGWFFSLSPIRFWVKPWWHVRLLWLMFKWLCF